MCSAPFMHADFKIVSVSISNGRRFASDWSIISFLEVTPRSGDDDDR